MTPAIAAGIVFMAAAIGSTTQAPPAPEAPDAGKRIESDSYTVPEKITRCIAYNINKKMPELSMRTRQAESADEGAFIILSRTEPSPATFGVIRIARSEEGSHLTTWLPRSSLSGAPEAIAQRLIAGC